MPEPERALTISRIAQLELKDEQRLVKEGYQLLDEKRIRLAAEIRTWLGRFRKWRADSTKAEEIARAALRAAVAQHGLEELSVYPPLSRAEDRLQLSPTRLFGLEVLQVHWQSGMSRDLEQPVNPTPEARACALAYQGWLAILIQIAACCVNLRRLLREYIRTERRARAIENVLMPELERSLKFIEAQLEGLDQEDIARVRLRREV